MAQSTMDYFKTIIYIMLFYSFSISLFTYSLPAEDLNYVSSFSDLGASIDLESVSSEVQGSVESQTDLPVLDVGALVFYSGNFLIDLLLNFAYAIPQMIALLITGLMMLLSLDTYIVNYLQFFLMVTISVMYMLGIIQLLTGIRSGRLI